MGLWTFVKNQNSFLIATKLQKMAHEWCNIFLTLGIFVAVFGMRFLFPIIVVSVFANIGFMETVNITFNDADTYTKYLYPLYYDNDKYIIKFENQKETIFVVYNFSKIKND